MIQYILNVDYFLQHPILWILIALAIYGACFALHQIYLRQNVASSLAKRKNAFGKAIDAEQKFQEIYGALENKSIVYKFDRLILMSGIKNKIPFVTTEGYFITMVISALLMFMLGIFFSGNIFLALFLGIAAVVLLYVFLIAQANSIYNKIEDDTSIFVSLLSNHSKGSTDITTIMKKVLPNLKNPMYKLVQKFIQDADSTGSTDLAFDIMKESIDNKQLRTIIVNLKNCSHYQANYEEVLTQMMSQITAGLSARAERKNILWNGKILLATISIMASVIVIMVATMLNIDVREIMLNTMVGQFLLFVMGVIYLSVLVSLFATDK